jgi:hypothetical protein
MLQFRESVGEASDYGKMLLFLGFEKVPSQGISNLVGVVPAKNQGSLKEQQKKSFIPYLKEKLIWS